MPLWSHDGCWQGHGHLLPCLCPLGNSFAPLVAPRALAEGQLLGRHWRHTGWGGGQIEVCGLRKGLKDSCHCPCVRSSPVWPAAGTIFPLSHLLSDGHLHLFSPLPSPASGPCPASTELTLTKPQDVHTAGPVDSHSVSHRPSQPHPWLICYLIRTCLYVLVCGSFFHLRCLSPPCPIELS